MSEDKNVTIENDLADCGELIRMLRNQLEEAQAQVWRIEGILKGERARRQDAETALLQTRAANSVALEYIAYVDAYTDTSGMSEEQRQLYDALWQALTGEE